MGIFPKVHHDIPCAIGSSLRCSCIDTGRPLTASIPFLRFLGDSRFFLAAFTGFRSSSESRMYAVRARLAGFPFGVNGLDLTLTIFTTSSDVQKVE